MEVRDRILEEATRQFFKYGIRNVTMDDIAVSLGISKRTVYETFKDKTELVGTCMRYLIQKQDKMHQEIVSTSANVIEAIFRSMQQGMKAMSVINPVFFMDLKKYYPALSKSLHEENKEKHIKGTHTMLRRGVNEGLYRKEINIEIVSRLFHEQMNLIMDENIFSRDEFDITEVFSNLIINFTRGISTNKGIELIDRYME